MVSKEAFDRLLRAAEALPGCTDLSKAEITTFVETLLTRYLETYPFWYGRVDATKPNRASRQYAYERVRSAEREQLAAEKVAAWTAGYRVRLERRIKAGYIIPQTALAGTGLHVHGY